MPINIPTLKQIQENIKNDLETRLGITIPTFGSNFLYVFSGVLGAKIKLIYNSLNFVNDNITPDTAVSERFGGTLERWGRIKIEREPFEATNGIYNVTVTGQINSVITSGQTFRSKETATNSNQLYVVDIDFTMSSTTDIVQVRSLEVGRKTTLSVGDELLSTSPIVGIDNLAVVSSVIQSPLDAETDQDYKDKVTEAFRLEPQGGAVGDFRLWSFDAQGVKRVYPYAKDGESGSIDLFVEANVIDSTDGNGTPPQAVLDDVEEVIELDPDTSKPINERGRFPIGITNAYVLPVTPLPVDVFVNGLVGGNTIIETTIEGGIKSLLSSVRPFIAGADVLSEKNDVLSNNLIAANIVDTAPKTTYFSTVSFTVNGTPATTIVFDKGNIPYFNSVTFN